MNSKVIAFAREELEKYLKKVGYRAQIELGLFEDFGIDEKVEDPFFDDGYVIKVHNNKGFIAGVNERSVLFGVYRLLEEWGITWVRPGPNGDHLPENPSSPDLDINEKPSLRYRTMCIEGAISFENVLDMVDYIAKVGFNGYFVQFENAFQFFNAWYSHKQNPYKEPEEFNYQMVDDFMLKLDEEIHKRGLLFHRIGHGWHSFPFGIPDDPAKRPKEAPEGYVDICAEKDGKREVDKNGFYYNQLCFTRPRVINTIADAVIKYFNEHPEVDVLHFWLADALNNTCECEDCAKYRYSDAYVNIINEVTDRMKANGITKKIIPIAFLNTLWPPIQEKLRNKECLAMTWAPITRTYVKSFPNGHQRLTAPEYKINGYHKSYDIDENLSYLYEWQKEFEGDWIDYDYHLMWDQTLEAGGEGIAKIISEDLKNFESLGLKGLTTCQLQRNAFPTSIGMTTMAKTMWNKDADFDKIREKLYFGTFGRGAAQPLMEYFSTLSDCFDLALIKDEASGHDVIDKDADKSEDVAILKAKMEKAIKTMADIEPFIKAHFVNYDPCEHDSWRYLDLHRQIYTLLAKSILARINGEYEKANQLRDECFDFAFKNEDFLQPVFDCFRFSGIAKGRIRVANPEIGAPALI
ncbi:MAG: DUF4838 domain-containing protein [Ruminococcaceae bacterium]|nr:DUF4838 domain-containing protein [Oscillospiraceae bacterium]